MLVSATPYLVDSAWLLASFSSNSLMTFSSISTGKTHFEYEGLSVGPKVGESESGQMVLEKVKWAVHGCLLLSAQTI